VCGVVSRSRASVGRVTWGCFTVCPCCVVST
jgi:hypothetical protein